MLELKVECQIRFPAEPLKMKVKFQSSHWRYNTQNNSADLLKKLHLPSFIDRKDTAN